MVCRSGVDAVVNVEGMRRHGSLCTCVAVCVDEGVCDKYA